MIEFFIGGVLTVVLAPVLFGLVAGGFLKLWSWFCDDEDDRLLD
jgi:hypothetical protein